MGVFFGTPDKKTDLCFGTLPSIEYSQLFIQLIKNKKKMMKKLKGKWKPILKISTVNNI